MFKFFKNIFSKNAPSIWKVDKAMFKGKYQDLKHRFMQDHGSTFQIHYNETGLGINIVLFHADAKAVELKHFIKIIDDNYLKLSNVIFIQDNQGMNITLVCVK